MKHALRSLALILALQPALAAAQQFPVISDHSVIGRIGVIGQSGPSQAIPFATLLSQMSGLNNKWTGDAYFGSGRPWCDVRAKGAIGNNVTDDHAAILACYNQLVSNFGGGTIYFPPSNGAYCDKVGTVFASQAIILQGSTGSNGTSQISACGADVTPVTLNGFSNIISRMAINGSSTVTTTKPALVLGTQCTECIVSDTRVAGGLNAIDVQAFDFHLSDIHAESAYGSAIVRVRGGGYLTRTKLDQLFPNATAPAYGTVISAWAATHVYTQGTIVSDGGFYIQATVGGTSGSSLPPIQSYNTAVVDGTVTWKLVAPTTYYSLQFDTGATSSYEIFGDHTGPFTAGVAITNTLAGAAPQAINIDHTVTGQVFQAGLLAIAGNDFTVTNSQLDGCILTGCGGVQMSGSWVGDAVIVGNSMWSNGHGVNFSVGSNVTITGNQIVGNFVTGVNVAGNLSNFSIVGNNLGSSPLFGANGNAVIVNAGTGDNYNITGNNVRGASVGITDGGTGTHKTVGPNENSTINKVTITPPANGATLTLADGTTLTGPPNSGTVMTLENNQTVIGQKSFASGQLQLSGSSSGAGSLVPPAAAASYAWTFPAATTTLLGADNTATVTSKSISGSANTLSNIANSSLTNSAINVAGVACTLGAACGLANVTNIIGADVSLSNVANFFDGPLVANGLVGTYFASGTVQIGSSTANDAIICKLWDGTTTVQEAQFLVPTNSHYTLSLSGIFTTPAANIRISCRDTSTTNGFIYKDSGLGTNKASALTAFRIQ